MNENTISQLISDSTNERERKLLTQLRKVIAQYAKIETPILEPDVFLKYGKFPLKALAEEIGGSIYDSLAKIFLSESISSPPSTLYLTGRYCFGYGYNLYADRRLPAPRDHQAYTVNYRLIEAAGLNSVTKFKENCNQEEYLNNLDSFIKAVRGYLTNFENAEAVSGYCIDVAALSLHVAFLPHFRTLPQFETSAQKAINAMISRIIMRSLAMWDTDWCKKELNGLLNIIILGNPDILFDTIYNQFQLQQDNSHSDDDDHDHDHDDNDNNQGHDNSGLRRRHARAGSPRQ